MDKSPFGSKVLNMLSEATPALRIYIPSRKSIVLRKMMGSPETRYQSIVTDQVQQDIPFSVVSKTEQEAGTRRNK